MTAEVSPMPRPSCRLFKPAGPGFTLVEVLVTVVVIAIGCLAALHMQASAMGGAAQADHLTAAASLGASELERLKALSFGEVALEAEKYGLSHIHTEAGLNRQGRAKGSAGAPGPWPYTRVVRYYLQKPTKLSHLVEVSVTWKDSQGRERQLDYSAVLTNFSLGSD